MSRPKVKNKNVRKLTRMGRKGGSLGLTLPIELVHALGWRERQKVVVTKRGKTLHIVDWKK